MTDDEARPGETERSLHDLLSREEIQELLSPLDHGDALPGDRRSVLFIGDRAEDVETIADHLRDTEFRVVPAGNRYGALDLFRRAAYMAVVADVEALGADVSGYLRRLRAVDPEVRLAFFCPRGTSSSPAAAELDREGILVERPLDHTALERLFAFLPSEGVTPEGVTPEGVTSESLTSEGLASPVEAEDIAVVEGQAVEGQAVEGQAVEGQAEGRRDVSATRASDALRPARAGSLDALGAVQALLESRVEGGGGLEAGLRRWAETESDISGFVVVDREGDEWTLRASGGSPADRRAMMEEGVGLFGLPDTGMIQAAGNFYLFRDPDRQGAPVAIWRGAGRPADDETCRRLEPLMRLLKQLPGGDATATSRQTLLEVVQARMKSCERRDGRLAVLVAESTNGDDPRRLRESLRDVLRGSDWIQSDARRVYALLDEPEHGWRASLRSRLRAVEGHERLRVVGVGWNPLGGDAASLVDRAERTLSAHPEAPFLALEEPE